ncbi:MAG: CehA/McbA family metallohydrolase, partial [Acidimicrobiales bacterium]
PGLTVSVLYDRTAAVIDVGLFGPDGFRGWSGGEREWFTVSAGEATPGYVPGPLEPGSWQVVLGLYRVPGEGVEVSVVATPEPTPLPASPAPPAPAPGLAVPILARPPAPAGKRWVAGDLHAHSVHSDGQLTVEQLAFTARSQGLDFLAVTDHNTVSHHAHLAGVSRRYGITLLPGQEVTTPQGHAGALGAMSWVDFRRPADAWLAQAEAEGGLLAVNHPEVPTVEWDLPLSRPPHLVEAWHGTWSMSRGDRSGWGFWSTRAPAKPVGGSDYHRPGDRPPGCPTTWLEVDDTSEPPAPDQLVAALGRGPVAMSASPAAPLAVPVDGEVVAVGAEGLLARSGFDGGPVRVSSGRFRASAGPGLWSLAGEDGSVVAVAWVPPAPSQSGQHA